MDFSSPQSSKGIQNGEIRHSPRLLARTLISQSQSSVQNYLLPSLTNASRSQENLMPSSTSLEGSKRLRAPAAHRWTKPEDVLLAECWAHATKNPIKGTDQKMEDFWKTVWDLFKTGYQEGGIDKIVNVPYESRRRDSTQLQNRFRIVLPAVQVFAALSVRWKPKLIREI